MEELTIEEKARRYDEVIKKVEWFKTSVQGSFAGYPISIIIDWFEKQGEQGYLNTNQECLKGIKRVQEYQDLSDWEKKFDNIASMYAHNKNQEGYNNSLYVKERAAAMLYRAKKELERRSGQKELNLVEILKHYPKETELYSPLYGKLWLAEIDEECEIISCYKHPLDKGCTRAILEQEDTVSFYSNGTTGLPDFSISKDCMLFLYDNEKHGEQIVQPKQEWSEEDKTQLNRAIYMMGQLDMTQSWDDVYNWLKSLKERMQPQQKQEWSKEDEEIHRKCICAMRASACGFPEEEKFVEQVDNWLKSLKDRVQFQNIAYYNPYKEVVESIAEMCVHYANSADLKDFYDNVVVKCKDAKEYDSLFPYNTWKPSEEQMEYLLTVKILSPSPLLDSLYNDLKKLMEE